MSSPRWYISCSFAAENINHRHRISTSSAGADHTRAAAVTDTPAFKKGIIY